MKLVLEIELGSAEMKTYRDVRASIERGLLRNSEDFDTYLEVGDGSDLLDVHGMVVGNWAVIGQYGRPEQILAGLVKNAEADVLYQLSNKLAVDLGLGNIMEDRLPAPQGREVLLLEWANEFNLRGSDCARERNHSQAISDFYDDKTKELRTATFVPIKRLMFEVAKANDACELLESASQHIEHYRDTEELDSLDLADECISQAIAVFTPPAILLN